jgi:predicted PurR-regulated permease PerM
VDKNKWVRAGVGIIILFLAGVFLRMARPILVPFAMALLLGFAVSPALDFLVKRKLAKGLALALVLVLSFAVLYLIGLVFYSGGKSLADELPSYTEMVQSLLERIDDVVPDPRLKLGLTEWIQGINAGRIGTFLVGALGPFLSFMSDLLLVFLFMIFILSGRGRLARKLETAFESDAASALSRTALRVDCEVQRYLAVRTFVNVAIGILVAVVLAVCGVRFAVLFGVLAALFGYVPTLGPLAAIALPSIMTLILDGGLSFRFWLALLLLTGIHVGLLRFVEPRLMGKEHRLSPLLVLFSLFFWAWLWGVPGMILAVPLLTAARIIFENVPSLRFLATMMGR